MNARKRVTLVTGAGGEMGTGLIQKLAENVHTHSAPVLALDRRPLAPELAQYCEAVLVGDILDKTLLRQIESEYEVDSIFHLAALLSTSAEHNPIVAHDVNVQGTLNLLELSVTQSKRRNQRVRFLFPSSIAVYGRPTAPSVLHTQPVHEQDWNAPRTMYGCNKLACEHLGRYYTENYDQLSSTSPSVGIDFRSLRFPGLISAVTIPSGGTSDYAPEMLHAAAKGQPYACFVREDTRIPFMVMPDAIEAMLKLASAPFKSLSQRVYNISAFAPSAGEFAALVAQAFPSMDIHFAYDELRQQIVDSWPQQVDVRAAQKDWNFAPQFDLHKAFSEYLLPGIRANYS